MASINSTIVLISLPTIFRGLNINPIAPGEFIYLLWTLMGYSIVMATLLITLGRLSDLMGRVRLYTAGFILFTTASIALSIIPDGSGNLGADMLIVLRMFQAAGGGLLEVNGIALITDAFPKNERGKALGINQFGFIAGSLLGLIGGGLLASFNWHYVFLINVPFGIAGSLWSLLKLKDTIARKKVRMDIPGNISLGGGLVAISLGFTYALVPYHSSSMGWMNPWVIIAFIAGIVLLISFIFIEMRVKSPLFQLQLFKNKSFALGNFAYFLYTLGRMGVMFLLVIWLQGIYLPLHGVSYSNTPIRTGIMLLPLLGGMIALAPVGGKLADRYGPTIFATAAMIIIAASLYLLTLLPLNFNLLEFELILFVNGIGLGLFVAPNSLRIMNALPAESRGVGSGIRTTFGNIAGTISMAIFFSITITVFDRGLPGYLYSTGVSIGLPTYVATVLSNISPEGILFATFMGINPMSGLPHSIIALIPAGALKILMSTTFFPATIGHSFLSGFRFSVYIGIIITLIGTVLSAFAGKAKHDRLEQQGGDGGKTK